MFLRVLPRLCVWRRVAGVSVLRLYGEVHTPFLPPFHWLHGIPGFTGDSGCSRPKKKERKDFEGCWHSATTWEQKGEQTISNMTQLNIFNHHMFSKMWIWDEQYFFFFTITSHYIFYHYIWEFSTSQTTKWLNTKMTENKNNRLFFKSIFRKENFEGMLKYRKQYNKFLCTYC